MNAHDSIEFINWARHHFLAAVLALAFGAFTYGAYEFVGAYATKFGESLVASYTWLAPKYPTLDSILRYYLNATHASRIGVARFHGHVHDLTDAVHNFSVRNQYFVSYVTVLAIPGVATDLNELQDLPAGMFAQPLTEMLRGDAAFTRFDDVLPGPLRALYARRGIVAVLYVPIHGIDDQLIGMLTLSWINEHDVPNEQIQEAMKPVLLLLGDRVGAFLSGQ